MRDVLKRMLDERAGLKDKIAKLKGGLPYVKKNYPKQGELLEKQLKHMKKYNKVLNKRISLMKETINSERYKIVSFKDGKEVIEINGFNSFEQGYSGIETYIGNAGDGTLVAAGVGVDEVEAVELLRRIFAEVPLPVLACYIQRLSPLITRVSHCPAALDPTGYNPLGFKRVIKNILDIHKRLFAGEVVYKINFLSPTELISSKATRGTSPLSIDMFKRYLIDGVYALLNDVEWLTSEKNIIFKNQGPDGGYSITPHSFTGGETVLCTENNVSVAATNPNASAEEVDEANKAGEELLSKITYESGVYLTSISVQKYTPELSTHHMLTLEEIDAIADTLS